MRLKCTEYEKTGSMYEAVFNDASGDKLNTVEITVEGILKSHEDPDPFKVGDEYEFSKVN